MNKTPELTLKDVLSLIEQARTAEMCRDDCRLQQILQTVWTDFETDPDFSFFSKFAEGELLRLCGFFLTFGGRAQNLKNYAARAKDLLTRAIEIFDNENLPDKSAESKILLAFCYWNTGEVSEAEALLGLVENDFRDNRLHPVYLQLKINQMMLLCWSGKFSRARSVSDDIQSAMEFCPDQRLKLLFHFETAIVFHRLENYEKAIFHFKESIRLAKTQGNFHLLALTYNNFSLLYLDLGETDEAMEMSRKSLEILKRINHEGWIPHILDSQAMILFERKSYRSALARTNDALDYFYKGEDYKGLTAALWTRVRCLLKLGETATAFLTFAELERFAETYLGEVAARKFARKLSEEVYVLRNKPLAEELSNFKKSLVKAALVKAKGAKGKAAKILGLKNHQALSVILQDQYPGLYEQLGFRQRARRGSKQKPKEARIKNDKNNRNGTRSIVLSPDKIESEKEISLIVLKNKSYSFGFHVESRVFETYYFDRFPMTKFGIDSGAVVAVVPVEKLRVGIIVLAKSGEKFTLGSVEREEMTGIYFISGEGGEWIPVNSENVLGTPVGYCLIENAKGKFIEFSRLI